MTVLLFNAQAHPEKAALCQDAEEARHVAAQANVRNAYIPDGSKYQQKGQMSVRLQTQAELSAALTSLLTQSTTQCTMPGRIWHAYIHVHAFPPSSFCSSE